MRLRGCFSDYRFKTVSKVGEKGKITTIDKDANYKNQKCSSESEELNPNSLRNFGFGGKLKKQDSFGGSSNKRV